MKGKGDWRVEFGPDWDVPPCIETAPELADDSWKNDTCPSFIWIGDSDDEPNLRLFCDYPTEEGREETESFRYSIHGCTDPLDELSFETLWEGNDPEEAVRQMRELARIWHENDPVE
jgi:hypothetical protein